MNKKKSKSVAQKNVPLDITEHPATLDDVKVAPEIITDQQELVVSPKKHELPKEAEPYKWQPGQSGNPSGRPRDTIKEIGRLIAAKKMDKVLKPKERKLAEEMGFDVSEITLLENLMLGLATSKNPMKIELFLQRTYGKVPNININAEINAGLVARFKSKFTDSELEAIGDGANAMDILFDKLPDVEQDEEDTLDGKFIE